MVFSQSDHKIICSGRVVFMVLVSFVVQAVLHLHKINGIPFYWPVDRIGQPIGNEQSVIRIAIGNRAIGK